MTPKALDPDTVHEKLATMQETLAHLQRLGPLDAERLRGDPVVRAAAERWLTVLVDLAVSVNLHVAAALLGRAPRDYATSFLVAAEAGLIDSDLAAELQPSAGARNVLVHEYVAIDLDLVADAVAKALALYPNYVRQVAIFLRNAT